MARGEIIGLINADDYYAADAVELIVNQWRSNPHVDIIAGNAVAVNEAGEALATIRPDVRKDRGVVSIPHPAAFVTKQCYHRVGGYDESFCYAGDKEWFLRAVYKDARVATISPALAYFRAGGFGSRVGVVAEVENFWIDRKYRGIGKATYLFAYHFVFSYMRRKLKRLRARFVATRTAKPLM